MYANYFGRNLFCRGMTYGVLGGGGGPGVVWHGVRPVALDALAGPPLEIGRAHSPLVVIQFCCWMVLAVELVLRRALGFGRLGYRRW